MKDAVTELLFRYELGDFDGRVRARLEEIFAADPPDAMERLERAAAYLGLEVLTPRTLERVDDLLSQRSRRLANENLSTPTREEPMEAWTEVRTE